MARTLYSGVTTAAASVTVYWADTTVKPTIYVSATGDPKDNPVTADALGNYSFWIDDGHYKIVNGSVAGDLTDVRINSSVEARPSAKDISCLPYRGSTATTLEELAEGLINGTTAQAASTAGSYTATGGVEASSAATGDIVAAGGIAAGAQSWFGGEIIQGVSANGSTATLGYLEEEITLSTSGTTTDSDGNLLLGNSIIRAVVAKVTETITTATDWQLGDASTAGRFTDAISTMIAGTTDVGLRHMAGDVTTVEAGPTQASAAKIRITTTGTPGAGKIRVGVFMRTAEPPLS